MQFSLDLVLELVIAASVAVWVVSQVRITTVSLSATIEHLAKEVGRLDSTISRQAHLVDDHEIRLKIIEEKGK